MIKMKYNQQPHVRNTTTKSIKMLNRITLILIRDQLICLPQITVLILTIYV